MNNPKFLDQHMEPGFLCWLEDYYPYYYECAVKKEYKKIPGKMYQEYWDEINKKEGIDLYSKYLEDLRAM